MGVSLNQRQSTVALAIAVLVLLLAFVNSVLPAIFGWSNPLFLPHWLTVCVNVAAYGVLLLVFGLVLVSLIGWADAKAREQRLAGDIAELISLDADFPGDVLLAPNLEEAQRAGVVTQLVQLRRDPQVQGIFLAIDRKDDGKVCDRVFLATQKPGSAMADWESRFHCERGRLLKRSGETLRRRFHLPATPGWELVWD
jgi:hypothetical protein